MRDVFVRAYNPIHDESRQKALPRWSGQFCVARQPMTCTSISAFVFCMVAIVVSLLQVSLALGAPLGGFAMGGRFEGRFPTRLRLAAVFQLFLVIASAVVVLIRAELYFASSYDLSRSLIWCVVALFSVSLVLNSITPSRKERLLGVPLAAALFTSSLYVALS